MAGTVQAQETHILLSQDQLISSQQRDDYGEHLGTVHFPVSCNKTARQNSNQGLALLHHMTYEGASLSFDAAIKADPDCAMAYWGKAMSFIHPLWSDQPSEANFEKGRSWLQLAKHRGQKSNWEHAYITAVDAYYAAGWRQHDEKKNLTNFEQAWRQVYLDFPHDSEAASFYALAHLANADPADENFSRQKKAAEIARQVLTQIPDHPGAHHYIIHAYDYPSLAQNALTVARRYSKIATHVPHALHMPSHIFTRLGLWAESIQMNQRAAAAAWAHPVAGKISLHYLHALDYLVYAYLQRAEDDKTQKIVNTLLSLAKPAQVHIASAYSFAAIPARFVLERQQWAAAAALKLRTPPDFPWHEFPAIEAITYFARALGAARSGNGQVAKQALKQLTLLHNQVESTSEYWARQIKIQQLSAQAWLLYQQGKRQQALETMGRAAEMEAAMEKHPVSPGMILPAQELFADMLLATGQYQQALIKYQASLTQSPNRFNSLYGAARAAEQAGKKQQAALYYHKLMEISAPTAQRRQVQQARNFLEKNN